MLLLTKGAEKELDDDKFDLKEPTDLVVRGKGEKVERVDEDYRKYVT